jgi:hypothetical protein
MTPSKKSSPASVTMNEGMRALLISVPCSAPSAPVTATAARIAAHHGAADPGHEAKGQVDLAEQKREYLSHPDQHEHRALDEQVDDVAGGQELGVLALEDEAD